MKLVLLFVLLVFALCTTDFLKDYKEDPELGLGEEVVVVVKSFKQVEKNKRAAFYVKNEKKVFGRTESREHDRGVVFTTKIPKNGDLLDIKNADWKYFTEEPSYVDFHNDKMIVTKGKSIVYFELDEKKEIVESEISNKWFRHLHTAVFSPEGDKILVSSPGFDMVLEVDPITEEIEWEWCPWEHGFEKASTGEVLTRSKDAYNDLVKSGNEVIFVEDPDDFGGIGIPTGKRACHTNGAFYFDDDVIGVSFAHQNKIIAVNMETGEPKLVLDGLKSPHGFQLNKEEVPCKGFFVTDTKKGEMVFLDEKNNVCKKISTVGLDGVTLGREEVGEWIQFSSYMGNGLYNMIDVHRNKIHIIDPVKKTFRSIPYPTEYAIQAMLPAPKEFYDSLEKINQDSNLVLREVKGIARERMLKFAENLKTMSLNERELSDFEMMGYGALSPNQGFMTKVDFDSVLETMRLSNGKVWSLPIVKSLTNDEVKNYKVGEFVALVDMSESIIGVMEIEDIYEHDKYRHSLLAYGTNEVKHPGVKWVMEMGDYLVGGKIWVLNYQEVKHPAYFRPPAMTRKMFKDLGWKTVTGFQTRNPLHKSHEYLLTFALETTDGLMIHPLVGATKKGDIVDSVRMASYEMVQAKHMPKNRAVISTYPAWMRYAGPREAMFHALVRANYGCTHFVVGRDHAGVGGYYGPFDAQELVKKFGKEIGIELILIPEIAYCDETEEIIAKNRCPGKVSPISGSQVRNAIGQGLYPPAKWTREDIGSLLLGDYWLAKFDDTPVEERAAFFKEIEANPHIKEITFDDNLFIIYHALIKGKVVRKGGDNTFLIVYDNEFTIMDFIEKVDGKQIRKVYVLGRKPVERVEQLKQAVLDIYKNAKEQQKGLVLWFTGLPSSGKTTLGKSLTIKLKELGVTVEHLDGDWVRKIMNRDLKFSAEDRNKNIARIRELTVKFYENGAWCINSFVSPYRKARNLVRGKFENFMEVFVNAPVEVCEERDVKGLFKLARDGIIPNFTGVSAPYEEPENPEIEIRTDKETLEESVEHMLKELKEKKFL